MAHVMLDGKTSSDAAKPVTNGPVVRLNPLIQPVLASRDGRDYWILPRACAGRTTSGASSRATPSRPWTMTGSRPWSRWTWTRPRIDEVSLIRRFAEVWMADHIPNQPVRADGRLDCQIGHRWFSAGAEPGD